MPEGDTTDWKKTPTKKESYLSQGAQSQSGRKRGAIKESFKMMQRRRRDERGDESHLGVGSHGGEGRNDFWIATGGSRRGEDRNEKWVHEKVAEQDYPLAIPPGAKLEQPK